MSETPTPAWHMRRALRLAEKGQGFVLPNPMVGAVIIKNGKRIGEGYHPAYGEAHAEINALNSCELSPEGASLYVTLEPCDHYGKTEPCTQAIIKSGIKHVVIASLDPSREGVKTLQEAGIKVEYGLLEEQAKNLNKAFFVYHEQKRPFITLKAALTLDGKIAESRDKPYALSSDLSKKLSHVLRHQHHAILIGAGTLISDDPHLGVRSIEGRDPLRLVWKGVRELPQEAHFFRDQNHSVLEEKTLSKLLETLYNKGVVSLLVEGGAKLHTQFIEAETWDEMKLFYTPHILGEQAVSFFEGRSASSVRIKNVRQCGPDFLVTALPLWDSDLT